MEKKHLDIRSHWKTESSERRAAERSECRTSQPTAETVVAKGWKQGDELEFVLNEQANIVIRKHE